MYTLALAASTFLATASSCFMSSSAAVGVCIFLDLHGSKRVSRGTADMGGAKSASADDGSILPLRDIFVLSRVPIKLALADRCYQNCVVLLGSSAQINRLFLEPRPDFALALHT